jgi:hypothetical protein
VRDISVLLCWVTSKPEGPWTSRSVHLNLSTSNPCRPNRVFQSSDLVPEIVSKRLPKPGTKPRPGNPDLGRDGLLVGGGSSAGPQRDPTQDMESPYLLGGKSTSLLCGGITRMYWWNGNGAGLTSRVRYGRCSRSRLCQTCPTIRKGLSPETLLF